MQTLRSFPLWLTLVLLTALPWTASGQDDERPFPAGTSSHELHGLTCSVVMPEEWDPAAECSLVVILHGAGGTETGMAGALRFLAKDGYVVVAPKSRGQVWEARDLDDVRAITRDLHERLHVGAGRLHGIGFSNGGWNLAPVVFDEELPFASATWVAAGYRGEGKVPKRARDGMGVLALAGSEDGNRDAAEATPDALREDVRSVAVRLQPGLGHEWPDDLMPFYGWWLGVQEGRYVPGETLAFDWQPWTDDATTALDGSSKAGGFLYLYAPDDEELGRVMQNELHLDLDVQFLGAQLTAWKADAGENPELLARFKAKSTPAIVVFDGKGKVKKTLTGKLSVSKLAKALRPVAPIRKRDS